MDTVLNVLLILVAMTFLEVTRVLFRRSGANLQAKWSNEKEGIRITIKGYVFFIRGFATLAPVAVSMIIVIGSLLLFLIRVL